MVSATNLVGPLRVNGLFYDAIAGLDLRPADETSLLRLLAQEPHLACCVCGSHFETHNFLVAFVVLALRPANDMSGHAVLGLRPVFALKLYAVLVLRTALTLS